jgi:ribA/ribD-fused uncharacterized protein
MTPPQPTIVPFPPVIPPRIDSFRGAFAFLSNFYPAPFTWNGWEWPTSEHAYQAAKTNDPEVARRIQACLTPGLAKRAGKVLVLREGWDEIKVATMREIVTAKFAAHPALAHQLAATAGAELVEGNTWGDRFWGVSGGIGANNLGRILMWVRTLVLANMHRDMIPGPPAELPPAVAPLGMKRFGQREVREAAAWAMAGGQGLHVWEPGPEWKAKPGIPLVFRQSNLWAHLFDQDRARLEATVRELGVRVVLVERVGERHQHVDLCGGPLDRAIKRCERSSGA